MANKINARQIISSDVLSKIATAAGTTVQDLLKSINSETTASFQMSAANSLVVSIAAANVANPITSLNHTASPIGGGNTPQFTSGTVTFPASSGGTVTVSPGNNTTVTVASGNWIKGTIYLDVSNNLNVVFGAQGTTEALATTAATPTRTISIGYVSLQNVGGVIQNIASGKIYQFYGAGTAYMPFLQTNVITDSSTTGAAATIQTTDIANGIVRISNASLTSISGIPAGVAGQQIAIINVSGNTYNINDNDTGVTAANRIRTGSGGPVAMANNATFVFTYDAVTSLWMLTGGSGSGSGSGGINYITFGNAEAGTQGWHPVNWQQAVTITIASPGVFTVASTTGMYVGMPISFTTTSALPTGITASTIYFVSSVVSGTTFQVSATLGGASVNTSGSQSGTHTSYPLVPINNTTVALSNLAFAVSATSPLVGFDSYTLTQTNSKPVGGQGVAYDFTIDSAYQAQIMTISALYNASSTFVASSGNVGSDSDLEFAIWDKTNGVLIQITPKFVIGNGANNFQFSASFQTAPNSVSYAIMVFSPTMNANATGWTFKFDNVQVGPISNGINASNVVASYIISTGVSTGSGTPINYDTKLVDTSNSVTTGVGTWKFTAPISGSYNISILGTSSSGAPNFQIYKNGVVGPYIITSSTSAVTGSSYVIQLSAGDFIDIRPDSTFTPTSTTVTGVYRNFISVSLSPNSSVSPNPSGNVVDFFGLRSGTQSVTANTTNLASITQRDTNGAWNGSQYAAPVSGDYIVGINQGDNGSTVQNFFVFKNGTNTFIQVGGTTVGGSRTSGMAMVPNVIAGDILSIRSTANTTLEAAGSITIFLLSGNSAASNPNATIEASYWVSANFTPSNTVPINFDSKEFDTTNSVTTSGTAWKFTAPISGTYQVAVDLAILSSNQGYTLYKNGSAYKAVGVAAASLAIHATAVTLIKLSANDFIDIRTDTSTASGATTGAALNSTAASKICIMRVGN